MHVYDTVSQASDGLKARGFTINFSLEGDCLTGAGHKWYKNDFEIVELYRYEGMTDPADEAVVYGVQNSNDEKGVLVTGYGMSSAEVDEELLAKLSTAHRDQ